eukprot:3326778-Amphidinium_carterae.1
MGPATTITVKLNPTAFLQQEGRNPPKQYTVKTMRQFIKLIDPQLDLKIQDIWQPATIAHDDAFIIRIAKENAHQALNRLTRHGFATTPQRSWQEDTGVIWLQDRAYVDAARAATLTLTAIPEENDWRKDSSLFLKQGAQRATYGLRIPKDYMDLGRAAAGLDNTKAHVLTGCSHKWSKQDVEKVLQLLHWDAKPQRPMGKYTWLIRATHPPQQDRYLMQCEHERLNLVIKPYAPPGQAKPKQDLGETRLLQETSWANVVKGDARLSVAHSPSKLRMDWGDIQDSDEEDNSSQEEQEDANQDQDDMEDGPDSRKRAGQNTPPREGEAEQEQDHSNRARTKETDANNADSRLQALVQDLTMQNAQQQKRIDELLGQIQALVAQVQALSGQMTAQTATTTKEEPKVEPFRPPPRPTLDQLRELQEDDGSITVTDPTTQARINYVLLPEESEVCVIAHPWAYADALKQQTNFKSISGANNLCFWRCVAQIMTDYRTDNTLHKPEDVKQEILDWAIRQAYQVSSLLDGETLAVTKQLKTDRKPGAMATEKSVAAAALYLGVRLTVLHEDMAQAWTFLGEAGNPVGPSYILKLKAEHFTLGQQVDIQPHVLP